MHVLKMLCKLKLQFLVIVLLRMGICLDAHATRYWTCLLIGVDGGELLADCATRACAFYIGTRSNVGLNFQITLS